MIKNWNELTNSEKTIEVPKIGELRGAGFSWDEIGDFYSVSSATIRDYYRDHKSPKSREIAESIINGTRDESLIVSTLLNRLEEMEVKFETLQTDMATISKANIQEANIGVLADGDRYFIYENEELKYSADTLQHLAEKYRFNWRWAQEKIANGMDNLFIGNGLLLRTSLKQNINGMNSVHMNTDDKVNAVVNALMAFCRNNDDTSALYAEMDRIKKGIS